MIVKELQLYKMHVIAFMAIISVSCIVMPTYTLLFINQMRWKLFFLEIQNLSYLNNN